MTIRLKLFSDLHADISALKEIKIDDRVDVVVVPGDVGEGAKRSFMVLRSFVPMKVPIVFVMGNHEYYVSFFNEELEEARRAASSCTPKIQAWVSRFGPGWWPRRNRQYVEKQRGIAVDFRKLGIHAHRALINKTPIARWVAFDGSDFR